MEMSVSGIDRAQAEESNQLAPGQDESFTLELFRQNPAREQH
jgi:hypothetical protein